MFGINFGSLNDFEEIFEAFKYAFTSFCLFSGIVSLLFLILRGFGLYNMCKRRGIKNGWLSFIPIVSEYVLGKVAAGYVQKNSKKSADLSVFLLILTALKAVCLCVFFAVGSWMAFSILSEALLAVENDTKMTMEMFSPFITFVAVLIITFLVAVAQKILYYIALWRIYALYDYNNSTVFLILSLFFNILAPIFIFIIRDYEPRYTHMERLASTPEQDVNG
ncbi:MAG: hypothetical protein ACOYJS_01250 [Acutalibacteraceae bacterium]|jgi:hypothetical protein